MCRGGADTQVWCAVMARDYEWTLCNPEAKVIKGVFMHFEDGLEIEIKRLSTPQVNCDLSK